MTVTVYHNPACGTSRNVVQHLRDSGIEPVIVEYLKMPPDRATLKRLLARMGMTARELLRRRGTPYDEMGLDNPALTEDQLIDAMVKNPILIERPIVATDHAAKLCRPADLVRELIATEAAR